MDTETVRMLVIDGGGVKGCASITFLVKLEEALRATGSSIMERFDVFAGTSTGALIVCAMVYGDLTPHEIMDKYFSEDALATIFPSSVCDDILGLVQLHPKYDGKGKRDMINQTIRADCRIRDTDKLVMITGYDIDAQQPMIYSSFVEDTENSHVLVRDVMDISSAAPAYFPMVINTSSGVHRRCIDGAVFANNPTDTCYAKVLDEYGPNNDIRVLSIGTGTRGAHRPPNHVPDTAGGIQWMMEGNLFGLLYDGPQNEVHRRMETFSEALGHPYVRVNGPVTNTSIDNICAENIASLKAAGDTWWENESGDVWQSIILDPVHAD